MQNPPAGDFSFGRLHILAPPPPSPATRREKRKEAKEQNIFFKDQEESLDVSNLARFSNRDCFYLSVYSII